MNLITKPYEQNFGFSSMTDEELFLINGGSMSGVKEFMQNFTEVICEGYNDTKDFLITIGQAFGEIGAGTPRNPDFTTKNPSHPANQQYYC